MPTFELNVPGIPSTGADALSIRHVDVKEWLNAPFHVGIIARSPNQGISLGSIVGQGIRLAMRPGEGTGGVRVWTGICSYMEQIEAEPSGVSTYRLQLVPRLWLMGNKRSCRLFQHRTLPQIARSMLDAHAIAGRFVIDDAAYRQLEYRVQYNETDLEFFNRIVEEAGITYFFSDESGESELVLADAPETRAARAGGAIRFIGDVERNAPEDVVYRAQMSEGVLPGRHRVRDFDFRNPSFAMAGTSPSAEGSEAALEQFSYEPGYSWVLATSPSGQTPVADDRGAYRGDQSFADDRARRALEGARASKRQVQLQTNALDLFPGVVFTISDHPHPDLGRALLVADTSIVASVAGDFTMSARALFADVPQRPPLRTRKPRIAGPQSAIVVGPENEEIHVDEFGRVRVQFHWDPEGTADEESSCWIRVSQGWAGAGYGMMMIPRVGQEVLVGFLDGDPDQPIIVGRVFNAHEQVPYPLPRHKTVSTWKSRSTPSSDGFNEIKFDDEAGSELVYMQAERDMRKLVKHDESITVRSNRSSNIGAVNSVHVGEKHEVTVAQADPPPAFPPTRFTMIDRKITLTTGEASIELDGPDIRIRAKGNISLCAGGGVGVRALGTGSPPGPPGPLEPGAIQLTAGQTMDLSSVGKMTLATTNELKLGAALNVAISSVLDVAIDANTTMRLASNFINRISGQPIMLNGPGEPAGRVGDPTGGTILSGSSTVLIGGVPTPIAGAHTQLGPFDSADQAARAAINHANPQSISENREYSGLIWRDPDTGQYFATNPQPAGLAGANLPAHLIPEGGEEVGMYHTHGDHSTEDGVRTDAAHDEYDSEHFSPRDAETGEGRANGNPEYRSYLGTPDGQHLVQNPAVSDDESSF